MAKNIDLQSILPAIEGEVVESGSEIESNGINKIALRRGKVRELFRMGYDPDRIVLALSKGIKISEIEIIKVPISESIVKSDIEYIRQEDSAISVDFTEKRAEILDKLMFIYNRAMSEYTNSSGALKNSFLNTALSVLNKITDIEGIKAPEIGVNLNIQTEAKVGKYATEIQKLGKDEQSTILTSIRTVLAERKHKGAGETGISS